jgi:transposase
MRILTHCPSRAQYILKFSSSFLRRLVRKKKHGRHGHDHTLVFKYLLVKQACSLTYRDLEEATGIDNSTFVKARKSFQERGVYLKFFKYLVGRLIELGYLQAESVAVDGSFVQTYSKRSEDGSAYWGKTGEHGYKLHALVDATSEVPIALVITDGKAHDSKLLIPLCEKLSSYKLNPLYVIADKAYDSDDLVAFITKKLGSLASIPIKAKHKQAKLNLETKLLGRTEDKGVYRKRTSVERVFSYLKERFNLGKEKTRGVTNFTINVFLSSICLLLEKFRGWRMSIL